jgi:hypothetical protein
MVRTAKPASPPAPTTSPRSATTTQLVQRVLIPLRHFASEIGRSRQFVYSEMASGRLTTVLHGGRRFVHQDERERYVAALLAASPRYGSPASSPTSTHPNPPPLGNGGST